MSATGVATDECAEVELPRYLTSLSSSSITREKALKTLTKHAVSCAGSTRLDYARRACGMAAATAGGAAAGKQLVTG